MNKEGLLPAAGEKLFDEIVIPQESQITPAFVLRFEGGQVKSFMEDWKAGKRFLTRRKKKGASTSEISAIDVSLFILHLWPNYLCLGLGIFH